MIIIMALRMHAAAPTPEGAVVIPAMSKRDSIPARLRVQGEG